MGRKWEKMEKMEKMGRKWGQEKMGENGEKMGSDLYS